MNKPILPVFEIMSDSVSGRKGSVDRTRQRNSHGNGIKSSDMSVYNSSEELVHCKASKESSVNRSSEEYFEYICDPCGTAGDHVEAQGFCTSCEEYLCNACFKSHSRGKATRNHTLADKSNMPQKAAKTCDPCKTADEKEDAVGYCDNCEEYLCSTCFRSHSRSKATKHHILMEKDSMPEKYDIVFASALAKININKKDEYNTYSYIRDINVKASGDKKICYIMAMSLISNNELVLVDYDNKSLKLVDIERNEIKDTIDFESEPFRLTTVSKDKVAVLLSEIPATSENVIISEQPVIQIITVDGTLSINRTIKLTGFCEDIACLNRRLYASFNTPISFQILQLSGAVYKTINPDPEVLKNCKAPRRIAVSPEGSLIYVSDMETKKVMGIDMEGKLIYTHQFGMPDCITISPLGPVYLSDRDEFSVYKVKPDLSEATVILGPDDGLCYPQAICFNAEKQHMYISSGSDEAKDCNYIKVFKCY